MLPPVGVPWISATAGSSQWPLRSGTGVALYNPYTRRAAWQYPTVTAAQIATPRRLIFQDGKDLVGIGP